MDPSSRGVPRRESIRQARRMSNWTAAALIAGTGTAVMALAHQAHQATAAGVTATGAASAGRTAGTARTGTSAAGPSVAHSVATTTASGVTVTTTTRTVNGKTIVARVRHAPAGRDD